MTLKTSLVALCSALPVGGEDDGVPEWVHLLPAGPIRTADGRGPYIVKSLQSLADGLKPGTKLPIDECHATDRAAPLGLAAPARGWIVELQAREDGLWGRVEWTGEGHKLMADKAYCGISPAILHSQDKIVLGVLRASLTNIPNLQGLVSLHSEENGMDWKAKLIELLGLDGSADDAAIETALMAKMNSETALNSQDLLTHPAVVALQGQLNTATGLLNGLREDSQRKDATAFVDGAIAEGRAGVKPLRDEYIALHMANPEQAAKLIGGMPVLKGATVAGGIAPTADTDGLGAVDHQVMALFGIDEDEYKAGLKAAGKNKEVL